MKVSLRLKQEKIDLLYYLDPNTSNIDLPYILTHWDLGHRSTFPFPEMAAGDEFKNRDHYFNTIVARAFALFSESQEGKNELANFAKITPEKVFVTPLFPGKVINESPDAVMQKNILDKYQLSEKSFFFYPAQFWAHKNHTLLIDAIKQLKKNYEDVQLVLTGSDMGNLEYIKKYISINDLSQNVKIAGFVENVEIYTFYKNARALVMPTFLGPSNMPPLEAAFLGCPVVISDLKGHHELLDGYADYFDPTDVDDLVSKLIPYLENNKANRHFDNREKFSLENTLQCIEKALLKLYSVKKTWE